MLLRFLKSGKLETGERFFRTERVLVVCLHENQSLQRKIIRHKSIHNGLHGFPDIVVGDFPKDNVKIMPKQRIGPVYSQQIQATQGNSR